MRQSHKDIQLAANLAAITLALFALASWAQTWPSTLIPKVLLVVGVGTVLLGYALETAATLAAVPGWRQGPVLASRLLIGAILVIAMLALPLLTIAIGTFVLVSLLIYGFVKLVPRARARYRTTPRSPSDAASFVRERRPSRHRVHRPPHP